MTLVQVIETTAVVSSAIFGILLATRNRMDFVGLFSVACAVAFGGGTLRDLFLDRTPLFWVKNPQYPMIVFGLALIGAIVPRWMHRLEPLMSVPDAIGLGLFTIVGTRFAVDAGCHPFVAVLIGVLTGTFGGVIGEIICNEVPSLFRSAPLCATCAFSGAVLYLVLNRIGLTEAWSTPISAASIVLFRLAAIRWDLRLPAVESHK